MSKRTKKQRKPRNMIVVGMILACKSEHFHDRRQERGGAKNRQREYRNQIDE